MQFCLAKWHTFLRYCCPIYIATLRGCLWVKMKLADIIPDLHITCSLSMTVPPQSQGCIYTAPVIWLLIAAIICEEKEKVEGLIWVFLSFNWGLAFSLTVRPWCHGQSTFIWNWLSWYQQIKTWEMTEMLTANCPFLLHRSEHSLLNSYHQYMLVS